MINIALVPTLMLVGVALRRARVGLDASHLGALIIYFTLPMLMFTEMLKIPLGSLSIGGILAISLVYLTLCFLVSYGLSGGFKGRDRGTVVFNSTFYNSMFLPFPLIYAFYGDLSVALVFSLPVLVVHNTIGIFMASYWGHGKIGRKALVSAATFPPIIAFLVGLLARPVLTGFVSSPAFGVLSNIGVFTVYLSLVSVGLTIPISKDSLLVYRNRITGLITLNRLLISPVLALMLVAIMSPVGMEKSTLLIMSLMPPAFTNLVIASRFGLDVKATSQSLFLPSLVSLVLVFALRFFTLI